MNYVSSVLTQTYNTRLIKKVYRISFRTQPHFIPDTHFGKEYLLGLFRYEINLFYSLRHSSSQTKGFFFITFSKVRSKYGRCHKNAKGFQLIRSLLCGLCFHLLNVAGCINKTPKVLKSTRFLFYLLTPGR